MVLSIRIFLKQKKKSKFKVCSDIIENEKMNIRFMKLPVWKKLKNIKRFLIY